MIESLEARFQGLTVEERLALYRPLYPEAVILKGRGRQVCSDSSKGRKEYANRREFLYEVYDHKCCLCCRPLTEQQATLEHPQGRGMSGSHRDDSVTVCLIACPECQSRKGSRRIATGEFCSYCGHKFVVGGKVLRECFKCGGEW